MSKRIQATPWYLRWQAIATFCSIILGATVTALQNTGAIYSIALKFIPSLSNIAPVEHDKSFENRLSNILFSEGNTIEYLKSTFGDPAYIKKESLNRSGNEGPKSKNFRGYVFENQDALLFYVVGDQMSDFAAFVYGMKTYPLFVERILSAFSLKDSSISLGDLRSSHLETETMSGYDEQWGGNFITIFREGNDFSLPHSRIYFVTYFFPGTKGCGSVSKIINSSGRKSGDDPILFKNYECVDLAAKGYLIGFSSYSKSLIYQRFIGNDNVFNAYFLLDYAVKASGYTGRGLHLVRPK